MTPRAIGIVVALAIAYTLADEVSDIVSAFGTKRWLPVLREVAFFMVVIPGLALAMFAIVAPALELAPERTARRVCVLALAAVAAATLASLGMVAAIHFVMESPSWRATFSTWWFRFWAQFALMCALLTTAAELHRRALGGLAAAHDAALDRVALEREMASMQLQVLQAQIEPHFLFNTLANVLRLYEEDVGAGRRMLDNLMRYLEVALPGMRDGRSTLGREKALIEAYLQLQQIRMGRRLQFEIDVADALHPLDVPPMMLLTLVENAIKHGLTPALGGGQVRVEATRSDSKLVLRVVDDGCGIGAQTSGGGMGLANTRARLAAQYGAAASLTLACNLPRGIIATLVMPASDGGAAAAPT